MALEFWNTGFGHKLLNVDIPGLVRNLGRLADVLEAKEKRLSKDPELWIRFTRQDEHGNHHSGPVMGPFVHVDVRQNFLFGTTKDGQWKLQATLDENSKAKDQWSPLGGEGKYYRFEILTEDPSDK